MEVPVYDTLGQVVEQAEISDELFAVPFNESVVHQAVVRQQANVRAGTAATKTRGMITGSTRKPFRQKHTGWARRGTRKSPLLRGGGVVFGPQPRSYRQRMPKKMRRLALKCVLSAKAQEGQLLVLSGFDLEQPSTKGMSRVLEALEAGSSTLVVTPEVEQAVVKSARNLKRTRTLPVSQLNVLDILSFRSLVMTLPAVRKAEEIWGSAEIPTENS
jgi:large subunit ribosomal protein L4